MNKPIARLIRKGKRFQRLPRFQKVWFLPIWLSLGMARAVILVVPIRQIAPALGKETHPMVPILDAIQQSRAIEIGRVVRLASRYTPWNSNCFAQAIVASIGCRSLSVPSALFLGVQRSTSGAMQAHAWVCAGRVSVTGGTGFDGYVPVACFT